MTSEPAPSTEQALPRVALITNSVPPYRCFVHQRLVREIPEVRLSTLTTHSHAYQRWQDNPLPEDVRPIEFGHGEPTNQQTQLRYSLREWRKGGQIIRWLKEHNVSAVFCQGCGDVGRLRVLRWCNHNKIPCFLGGDFNVCGDNLRGPLRWLKRWTYSTAIGWATGLMPCGQFGRELLDRYGGNSKPSFLYPFAPDTSLFDDPPADAVEQVVNRFPFLDQERRRIVFSARLMPVKRPDLAVQAFSQIAAERPSWELVILGDGVLRQAVESSVPAHLRDRIHFTGFVNDPTDLAAIYGRSDVLLLPSDHEPWGVVVVEAAAAGLAIVTTNVVGAAPELVAPDRNGVRFPVGDKQALVDALRVVTAEETIDAMRNESKQVFRDWCRVADPVDGMRNALRYCGIIRGQKANVPAAAALARTADTYRVAESTVGSQQVKAASS